jgi:hypothetical protein
MSLHLQGASLHALWQLESALLKRFEVPSTQALQLPSGCSSLLSVLAAQDELAAALTGYADAWDCGAVPYESVLRVVQQALASMRHGTRGRSRSATTGEQYLNSLHSYVYRHGDGIHVAALTCAQVVC